MRKEALARGGRRTGAEGFEASESSTGAELEAAGNGRAPWGEAGMLRERPLRIEGGMLLVRSAWARRGPSLRGDESGDDRAGEATPGDGTLLARSNMVGEGARELFADALGLSGVMLSTSAKRDLCEDWLLVAAASANAFRWPPESPAEQKRRHRGGCRKGCIRR